MYSGPVLVEQVWADMDNRRRARTLKVVGVTGNDVYCREIGRETSFRRFALGRFVRRFRLVSAEQPVGL